ncbi:MAG: FtsW/RodA/SpoVE family cell cycle protein [Lachnospiraceae bacterium]|nr:FtsW/RodA/SpoVE family cell cycle protein [Lachnospiraceae bacterium]
MAVYTLLALLSIRQKDAVKRRGRANSQFAIILIFDAAAFAILYLQSRDPKMFGILAGLLLYTVLVQVLYRLIYKKASLAVLNNMCMLISTGFVIQSRLGTSTAIKQLIIVAGSSAVCLVIPVIIRRVKTMRNLGWLYAVLGILLLGAVFAFGRISGGANLSVTIGGISFQFSEFVKITFVFFIASMLRNDVSFRRVVIVTILAALHVGILVLSKDLGAALIYFVAYIVMVTVATKQGRYALLGIGGMCLASVAAYHLFSHVRVRVQVWKNPFADYEGTGYQIVQALFGVCAGGWFGTGLFEGNPEMIPLAKEDFTYAAVCEEMGILFGICLIFLCMSMYLQIVSISTKLSNRFYRLVSIGLGTEYAFQVFLTVGGTTKFIPMTGITLPLVSYGGSSIMCTIIMLSIIQGLFMIREDEDEEHELLEEIIRRQNEKERQMNRAQRDTRASARMTARGIRRAAKRSAAGTRAVPDRKATRAVNVQMRENNPETGNETGKKAAGSSSRKVTGPAPMKPPEAGRGRPVSDREIRKTLESLQESLPQEKQDVDIDDLSRKIEDETEKSLNY